MNLILFSFLLFFDYGLLAKASESLPHSPPPTLETPCIKTIAEVHVRDNKVHNPRARKNYMPPKILKDYIPRVPQMLVFRSPNEGLSKDDFVYLLNNLARHSNSQANITPIIQNRLVTYLKQYADIKTITPLKSVMQTLSNKTIQGLSQIANLHNYRGLRSSFGSLILDKPCLVAEFFGSLDPTKADYRMISILLNGIIEEDQMHKSCKRNLINVTKMILKEYSHGEIRIKMLLNDNYSDWRISGEEFFEPNNALSKHLELIHMNTSSKNNHSFAQNLFRFGSSKAIANMILNNVLHTDFDYAGHRVYYPGVMASLRLNPQLTPEHRNVFVRALAPLFKYMNNNVIWGGPHKNLELGKIDWEVFGFKSKETDETQQFLLGKIEEEDKDKETTSSVKGSMVPSEESSGTPLFVKLVIPSIKWTKTYRYRLGLETTLKCPYYELEHAYNLDQRSLYPKDRKQEFCVKLTHCFDEKSGFKVWSLLTLAYLPVTEAYYNLCKRQLTPELLSNEISGDGELLVELQRIANSSSEKDTKRTRLPNTDKKLIQLITEGNDKDLKNKTFTYSDFDEIVIYLGQKHFHKDINRAAIVHLLGHEQFIPYLKSLSVVAQHEAAVAFMRMVTRSEGAQLGEMMNLLYEVLSHVDKALLIYDS